MLTVESFLGWLYLLLGPIVCALFAFALANGRQRLKILRRPYPAPPPGWPSVAVLIAAKDEERQIEKCVSSVLRQEYPNLDVIVVDDRSTDATGEILDRTAAADGRLKVVHLAQGSLPPGWGGKSFAL